MAELKILVLILAIEKNPWKRIEEEGQGPTWRSACPDDVQIIRYIGASQPNLFWRTLNRVWVINQKFQFFARTKSSLGFFNRAVNRKFQFGYKISKTKKEIFTNVPDLYSLIGAKTIEAFSASIDNFDFDYIYRTNVSSYVNLNKLQGFLKNKPRSGYYAGVIGDYRGIKFASGCGYFLSKDLVIKVLQNRNRWDHNLIDDVSLGKLVTGDLEYKVQSVERIDLDESFLNSLQINKGNQSIFHYRCKAADPNITIGIMKRLHQAFNTS